VTSPAATTSSGLGVEKVVSRETSRSKAGGGSKAVTERQDESGRSESGTLAEWLSSAPVSAWAAVQPPLADVDLRPYLFVAKDRKDYFGPASALGHLAAVVDQLLGPKLSVEALLSDLRRLAGTEAAQLFEAVRGRIMGADDFDTEPAGVAGLTALVRAHPDLQSNLLDFLEALPSDRTGVWAVSGWERVITEASLVTRLKKLLERWATGTGTSQFLKVAADGVLRTRKGGR
jgi:hypothetical protein